MFFLAKKVVRNVTDDIIGNSEDWERRSCQCCLYNEKKDTLISGTGMICFEKITHFNYMDRFQIRVAFMIYSAYESVKDV